MARLSHIFGWSPPENEEFVDVHAVSSPLPDTTFHHSDPNLNPINLSPQVVPGSFESTSPRSTSPALSTDGESPTDKRSEDSWKRAGPAWVARPRNEFILFRCDYVRKHTRGGKRVRRAPGAEAKSMSKKAAEAWHNLPPEERLYWKERANGERNEHAHRYPDYRYRPKKRVRQARSPPTKAAVPISLEKESKTATPSVPRTTESRSLCPSTGGTDVTRKLKAMPSRGYSSVPDLSVADAVDQCIRSTASQGWLSADKLSFGSSSKDPTPVPSKLGNIIASFGPSGLTSQVYSTPQSSQSSSNVLESSWNMQSTVQSTQFVAPISVLLDPMTELTVNTRGQLLGDYVTGGTPNPISATASSQQFPYPAEHESQWMSQLTYEMLEGAPSPTLPFEVDSPPFLPRHLPF